MQKSCETLFVQRVKRESQERDGRRKILRRPSVAPFETQGKQDRNPSWDFWLTITPPTPVFFVSVDSKEFRDPVSSLDATLMRGLISVDFKGVW